MRAVAVPILLIAAASTLPAQTGENVLLVVNRNDARSVQIAEYYRPRRSIPVRNVCPIETTPDEEISWEEYQKRIEAPVGACLKKAGLQENVLYIVTTLGVPLKISGGGSGMFREGSSVDSELALLYARLKGASYPRGGGVANPFFGRRNERFGHPRFPEYLVTRLAAWNVAEVKGMIDRALAARNRGRFVVDLSGPNGEGNQWLRNAAFLLPGGRVALDQTAAVLYRQKDVIGYAAWGSNDGSRKSRWLGYRWLPGAIATEFVSSNGRTMKRPPDSWVFLGWNDKDHMFEGSSQGLSADFIHEGATGVSGNVYEPFLTGCARPDYLLPAYYEGRNLAESYYMSLPYLSWMGVILGDPLCSLGKP
jgi:uncharacterized protein (TIGR03790 family)